MLIIRQVNTFLHNKRITRTYVTSVNGGDMKNPSWNISTTFPSLAIDKNNKKHNTYLAHSKFYVNYRKLYDVTKDDNCLSKIDSTEKFKTLTTL